MSDGQSKAEAQSVPRQVLAYLDGRAVAIIENIAADNLWKRMLRNVLTTTVTVAITLIHYDTTPVFGKGAYLAAMVTVFAHPGRRVGQLIEALTLSLIGLVLGLSWSIFGLWLSSLVIEANPSAAYAIRGIFLAFGLIFHGFFRSQIPRSFLLVLLFIIEVIQTLTTTLEEVTVTLLTNSVYPVLLAAAIILIVNITVFPEFSSAFLGETTISSLDTVSDALRKSGLYFVDASPRQSEPASVKDLATKDAKDPHSLSIDNKVEKLISHKSSKSNRQKQKPEKRPTLSEITSAKSSLRSKLNANRTAQDETQFEVAFSHLPPYHLKPISKKAMKRLVTHTVAMIGCCETRFALLGDDVKQAEKEEKDDDRVFVRFKVGLGSRNIDLNTLKPQKEIEFGDVRLLRYLLGRIKEPYVSFQKSVLQSIEVVKDCIAYAYDVPKMTSKMKVTPEKWLLELKEYSEQFQTALQQFDKDITETLEGAALLQDMKGAEPDIMPREEIFLIASFLLSVRQAATQISEMLACGKLLVQQRSECGSWRRLYLPHIRWRKWLYSGGEADDGNPPGEKRTLRQRPKKEDSDSSSTKPLFRKTASDPEANGSENNGSGSVASERKSKPTVISKGPTTSSGFRWRNKVANLLEWLQHSEDMSYALKLTVAAFLVTFPALVPSLKTFYYERRGTWAALQLIFVFDVAIGTSINNAYLRAIGTTLGSLWGWAAFSAGNGNPYVCTVMLFIGLIPSTYVQLGSQYQKVGMVTMVSMCVVALATELQTVPGTSTDNFLNRWIAFLVGGFVALLVEIILLPVKARTRLTESLALAIKRIGEMESCVAYGIEDAAILEHGFPPHVFTRFDKASSKAKSALDDAETFFPFCNSEPRLKGSFKSIAKVFEEIIFVLRQIVDKMDNMTQLRLAYGAGPLEEFNTQIYPYRRNVAGSISLILYAVHEALMTKYPLPQFIPSARLAHLRLVNRTREVVQEMAEAAAGTEGAEKQAVDRVLRRKYMSWNAASAAQVEIIEYLEELTLLVKLLVGANEFQSGLLSRPTFQQYAKTPDLAVQNPALNELAANISNEVQSPKLVSTSSLEPPKDTSLPLSLQRIQSRKQEAGLRKRITNDEVASNKGQ